MAQHVVGDWKSFHFRMIQPSDYAEVLQHLRDNFFLDEPMCQHMGYDDVLAEDLSGFVEAVMATSNLSFLALDKTTNAIAAVRLNIVVKKDEKDDIPEFKSPKVLPMIGVLMKLSEEAKIFERYSEIDHYSEFFLVSVGRDYRGFGLATEIYDRAFKLLSTMEFPLIKCVFTSPYTQKIARKRGFRELARLNFLDHKDENGERYFPNATEDEMAIVMVKELQPLTQKLI